MLTIAGTVDVHFRGAISTIKQTDERGSFALAIQITLHIRLNALHIVKDFLINDGLMERFLFPATS